MHYICLTDELTAIALTATESSLPIICERLTDYSDALMCLIMRMPGFCVTRLTELHGSIELKQASLTHESILRWSNSLDHSLARPEQVEDTSLTA